jgi:hypothetical protein
VNVVDIAFAVQAWGPVVGAVGLVMVGVGLARMFWPVKREGRQALVETPPVAFEQGVVKVGDHR